MGLYRFAGLFFSLLLMCSGVVRAGESGFLSNYEGLKFAPGEYGGKTVAVPNITDKMAAITKIMVDQPEIFIADESAYRGMKPNDALALAEALRKAVIADFPAENVVEEPGPDVVYLRMAITDIHLKKKKRRLLSYTPVGFVAHTARSLAVSDVMKKLDLAAVTIEMETLKAATGEHVGYLVIKFAPPGEGGSDAANWDNLMSKFTALGKQVNCRLNNSKLPEAERKNCKILDSYWEG